jgi:hypothetical protein
VRGCEQRILAARDIAADRADRDIFVPENYAGQGFRFDVAHGQQLNLCKAANLRLDELDVFDIAFAQSINAGLDLRLREPELRRMSFVELVRIGTHGLLTQRLDIGKYAFDGAPHLSIDVGFFFDSLAPLQIGDCHGWPFCNDRD